MHVFTKLSEQARQSYEIWAPFSKYYVYGSIAFPLAGYYEAYIAESCYNTFPIRFLMMISVVVLHFALPTGPRTESNAHTVWAIMVGFVLPFGFGQMMVQEAACTPSGANVSEIFVIQYVTALFLLIQLSGSVHLTFAIWICGTLPVLALLLVTSDPNLGEVNRVTTYYIGVYATILIAGSLAAQTNRVVEQARAQIGQMIGANIAHELRTPLASIRAASNGTLKHYPDVVVGYEKAVNAGLVESNLQAKQRSAIADSLSLIRSEVDYSAVLIDILLMNTRVDTIGSYRSSTFSAMSCVDEAIERFPYANSKEKSLVRTLCTQDFEITAPRILFTHVLLNLLKNSIYYVQRKSNAQIVVEMLTDEKGRNSIVVTDNGPGIAPQQMKYIFNRYYTTTLTGEGAGVGLSFCRSVMTGIGGDISCKSYPGQETSFYLTFPKN